MLIVKNQTTDYTTANFSEDETAWDSDATYEYKDETRDGHFIYKYAGADDTNTDLSPANDTTKKWVKTKPTNYYAMLDGETNTQTSYLETIDITIACNNFDSVSLIGLEAQSVQLILTSNSVEVYNQTLDLVNNTEIIDFFTYCFGDFETISSIYKQLPIYPDAQLQIIITNSTGLQAKCGRLVFGRSYYVGDAQYGMSLGLESYSRKVTDEFGGTTLQHRGAINSDSYEILIPTTKVPLLTRKAKEFDAIPLLFVMDEQNETGSEHLLNYGYWESFAMMIPDATKSTISLTIKGII